VSGGRGTERQYGRRAQDELFAPPSWRPVADVYSPPSPLGGVPALRSGPSVREFVRPAALLTATASAGQVRALLTGSPEVSGVLLVDRAGTPVRSVHQSRFPLTRLPGSRPAAS